MPSNTCRSVVVEMTALSDHNLLLIGKTLRETMVTITKALAANRQPPMAYAMLDAIDGPKAISVVPVTHIRSQFFRYKYGDKVSSLANFRHDQTSEVMADVCDSIERTIKHIKESVVNISRNNVLHLELTYVCGRHRDQVLQDFTALLADKRIDLSFLSLLNIVCIEPNVETITSRKPIGRSLVPVVANKRTNFKIPPEMVVLDAITEVKTIAGNERSIDAYFRSHLRELKATARPDRVLVYQKLLDANIEIMTNELNDLMDKRKELEEYLINK